MTKRKIEIKKIEQKSSRKVTHSKRHVGLFNKAMKLCELSSDAKIAVITFIPGGKPIAFGHPSVDSIVDPFLADYYNSSCSSGGSSDQSSILEDSIQTASSSKRLVREKHSWWELPVELMDLDVDDLKQYKVSLDVLKNNVAAQLEEMITRKARTIDFLAPLNQLDLS